MRALSKVAGFVVCAQLFVGCCMCGCPPREYTDKFTCDGPEDRETEAMRFSTGVEKEPYLKEFCVQVRKSQALGYRLKVSEIFSGQPAKDPQKYFQAKTRDIQELIEKDDIVEEASKEELSEEYGKWADILERARSLGIDFSHDQTYLFKESGIERGRWKLILKDERELIEKLLFD
jgi:hypothetical protein